ncbi:MAG: chemotaxis protein MotB [Proteobacteria bacterium]|nr:MAG: chemotaxis protein MotB [Pseudomonadota bacterium]
MKKSRHVEAENHDRWLVSYADFITLLFAFFVVMYATSNNDTAKQKEFEKSVRVNLNLATGSAGTAGAVPDAGAVIAEYIQDSEGSSDQYPKSGSTAEAADFATRFLSKRIEKATASDLNLTVRHDAIGVRVSLAASAFFAPGDYKLKRSSLKSLDQIAELLQQADKKVIVEGHTDDQPLANGIISSNWELGSMRATSVVQYLIKYKKLDPKRMAAISYADQKPLVHNDTEENRAKNRRIEILLTN